VPEPPSLFLVGPARSGTSLLYKALCLHPEAAYVNNWVRRVPQLPRLAVANRLPRALPAVRRSVWFGAGEQSSNAYVYGAPRSALRRAFPQPTEGEPLFRACGIPEYPWSPAAPVAEQQAALRRAVAAVVRADGGRVFVNKRIANNRRVPLLAAALPRARFVSLVRDGRAVAWSLSRVDWWEDGPVWFTGGTPRDWAAAGGDPWELAARNWVEEVRAVEAGLAELAPHRVLPVRYEEFVAAPLDTLERVAAFAGLAPSAAWRAALEELGFPDQNEGWRRRLPATAVETIQAVQADTLRSHGYA